MAGGVAQSSLTWRKVLGLAGLGVLLVSSGGCTVSDPAASPISAASTTTSPSSPPALQEIATAKREWVAGSSAPSYVQSTYLRHAATYLTRAIVDGVNDATACQTSVEQLRQLASLPETNDSPSQRSQARSDLRALNSFFDTKRLFE